MHTHHPSEPQRAITSNTSQLMVALPLWKAVLERNKVERREMLVVVGSAVRTLDQVIQITQDNGQAEQVDASEVLASLLAVRAELVSTIEEFAPEEAYIWTPEFQAEMRESEAEVAAGRARIFLDKESFDEALKAHGAHV